MSRQVKVTAAGETRFHRIWRRRSKEWDVTPDKEEKDYAYIQKLISLIFEEHANSTTAMRRTRQVLPAQHPEHLQATIANRPPPPTAQLAAMKASRY